MHLILTYQRQHGDDNNDEVFDHQLASGILVQTYKGGDWRSFSTMDANQKCDGEDENISNGENDNEDDNA